MAYSFVAASSQALIGSSAVVTAVPLTMACWFKPASTGTAYTMMSVSTNGGTIRYGVVTTAGNSVGAFIQGSSASSSAVTGTVSAGTWYHGAAVSSASNSHVGYLDGTGSATDTTDIGNIAGMDTTAVSGRYSTTFGQYYNGDIAEAAIWNVALSVAEIGALAKGYSPTLVRPSGLVFYAPLVRDLIDLKGLALSNTNSATVGVHPRVFYPRRKAAA